MKYFSALFLFLIVIGCSSSLVVVNNFYEEKKLSENLLTILPIPLAEIEINNYDDVKDDFGIDSLDADSFIRNKIYYAMLDKARRSTKYLGVNLDSLDISLFDNQLDSIDCFLFEKQVSEEYEFSILVPTRNKITELNQNPDIVIYLNNFKIYRNTSNSIGIMISLDGSGSVAPSSSYSDKLIFEYEFVFWDYNLNEPIKYGKSSTSTDIFINLTRENWEYLFDQIVTDILEDTFYLRTRR